MTNFWLWLIAMNLSFIAFQLGRIVNALSPVA